MTEINNELRGKRVLVTGGTQGIGEAIVTRLLQSGAIVVAAARSAPTEPQESVRYLSLGIGSELEPALLVPVPIYAATPDRQRR